MRAESSRVARKLREVPIVEQLEQVGRGRRRRPD